MLNLKEELEYKCSILAQARKVIYPLKQNLKHHSGQVEILLELCLKGLFKALMKYPSWKRAKNSLKILFCIQMAVFVVFINDIEQ